MADNSQDVRRFAGRIYTQAQRLIALTDDIIRLSRIERADLTENVPVELRALCDRAVETLRFTAEQKQVEIAVTGGPAPVRGDRQMLDELITNLMDNAVKYNRPGGRVDVSLSVQDGLVCLRVADTGIGIPKEHQERIFERFYRVDQSRSKQTGGTGLGLSIVKHVVERHGGSITLESVPGEGTAVTVRLPADTGHIG
jgi:two-component system phosphate regulon sensor histidine kinase PhoR